MADVGIWLHAQLPKTPGHRFEGIQLSWAHRDSYTITNINIPLKLSQFYIECI